ncbi:hypothetical protein LCGC14_2439170, partial [marine sediment metagenome]
MDEISKIKSPEEFSLLIQRRLIEPLKTRQVLNISLRRLIENIENLKLNADLKLV